MVDQSIVVSVVAEVGNSEDVLEGFVSEAIEVLEKEFRFFELLLVFNGSVDRSFEIAQRLLKTKRNVRIIVLSRIYSSEIAYTAGIENALGDYVVKLNLLFDPVRLVPEFVREARRGYDCVVGQRADRRDDGLLYRMFAKLFFILSRVFTPLRVNPNGSDFTCYSRRMVNSISKVKDRIRYLRYMQEEIGYSHSRISYQREHRSGAKKHESIFKKLAFGSELIVAQSDSLLRTFNLLSLFVALGSFVYACSIFVIYFVKPRQVEGFSSTNIVLSVFFAFLFFQLAVLGEYLAFVVKESKRGPLYHLTDELTSSSAIFKNEVDRNVVTV